MGPGLADPLDSTRTAGHWYYRIRRAMIITRKGRQSGRLQYGVFTSVRVRKRNCQR